MYIAAQQEYVLPPAVEKVLFILLLSTGTFYIILSGVRLRQENKRKVFEAKNLVHQSDSDDYTSVNYSSLPVAPTGLPPSLLLVIGGTLFVLGVVMAIMLMAYRATESNDPAATAVLGVMALLTCVGGLFLAVRSFRRLPRNNAEQDYQEFAKDNALTLQNSGLEEVTEQYRPIIAQVNISGTDPVSRLGSVNLLAITKMLSGTHRGMPFHFIAAHVSDKVQYYGVIHLKRPAMPEAQILSLLEPNKLLVDVIVTSESIYCVTLWGIPLDRVGTIALFRLLDSLIDEPGLGGVEEA